MEDSTFIGIFMLGWLAANIVAILLFFVAWSLEDNANVSTDAAPKWLLAVRDFVQKRIRKMQ